MAAARAAASAARTTAREPKEFEEASVEVAMAAVVVVASERVAARE